MNILDDQDRESALLQGDAPEWNVTTVLCVDDDPNVSEAIGRRLLRHGIRSTAAMRHAGLLAGRD